MKEKAASKSTNWNLRVIASRSLANCQSGRRRKAPFNSSIVNLLITALKKIALFDTVPAAILRQLAGIKMKRIDGEFGAVVKRIVGKPVRQFAHFRLPQPRQGDVRVEFVDIPRLADPADRVVHFHLQMLQGGVFSYSRPQSVRLLVAELTNPG